MNDDKLMEKLKDPNVDDYTAVINRIVRTLYIEMDGGFLENTNKYINAETELIYSCLRAIAVQIYSENVPIIRAEAIEQIKAKREAVENLLCALVTNCRFQTGTDKAIINRCLDQITALFEEKQVRRCPLCDEDYTPALQYEVCPHHKLTSLYGGK